MRILYLDHYIGSPTYGMEYRPYYMAREWVRQGHEVLMVGASQAHVRTKQPVCDGPEAEETIDGIRYLWLRTPAYQGNGLSRMRNMVSYVRGVHARQDRFVDWKPQAVIASSTYPWDIYPARAIARRAGARLVFELHDLWPLSPMEIGGMSRWHPFIMAVQHGEDYACRHADAVVSILPFADRHLKTRGMPADRYVHVPNGVDFDEWDRPAPEPDAAEQQVISLVQALRRQSRFVMGYAGSHNPGNALELLLDAAERLADKDVAVVLVGTGADKDRLIADARARGLSNVHFAPPVPKRVIPRVLALFDCLFYGLIPSPLYRYGVSANKLFDYMASGRPVVQSNDAANDLVTESGCGITVPPGDADRLAGAVLQLLSRPAQERERMGRNGADYVRRHHDLKKLAQRFLATLRDGPGATAAGAPSTAGRSGDGSERQRAQRSAGLVSPASSMPLEFSFGGLAARRASIAAAIRGPIPR